MTDLYLRDLVPIVELQALELKRLMRDKERLNRRIDSLINEIGWLRELQKQDQDLREKEQSLRLQMQEALQTLTQRVGPAPAPQQAGPGAAAQTGRTAAVPSKTAKAPASGTSPQTGKKRSTPQSSNDRSAAAKPGAVKPPSQQSAKSKTPAASLKAPPNAEGAPDRMEIPAFLTSGPRVGFDSATADDIRSIHGTGQPPGEAPIRKLFSRIKARGQAS